MVWAIALAFTRAPMITALEAMDLDEMSKGRFILGLGTGVQRVNEDWYNAQWGKPVAHIRETVNIIREFIKQCSTGEPIDIEGEYEHMKIKGYQRTYHRERDSIPIYLAGVGPVMVRTAGEIADGWISHELCSPAFVQGQVLPAITEGLDRAGRKRDDIVKPGTAPKVRDQSRQTVKSAQDTQIRPGAGGKNKWILPVGLGLAALGTVVGAVYWRKRKAQ